MIIKVKTLVFCENFMSTEMFMLFEMEILKSLNIKICPSTFVITLLTP